MANGIGVWLHVRLLLPNDSFTLFRIYSNMLTIDSVQDTFRSSYRSRNPFFL